MEDKKLENLACRLKDLKSLRRLFSEINYDFADKPVNKDNWNEEQKKIVQEARIIASKNDYQIYYIQTDTDSLKIWKGIATKIIKDNNGFCMVCSHNPSGFKWVFSSLSKEFSKSFSETRHIQIDIKLDVSVPKTFVEFLEKIKVDINSTASSIVSKISDAFDSFAIKIHDELTINVFEALKVLSEGIIIEKSNNLTLDESTLEEIRESSFILLYRIIFVLYAEDRNIFPDEKFYHKNFSLKWIKNQWILKSDNNISEYIVYERLKKLFKLIEMGSEELDYDPKEFFMRSYYGRLFDRKIHSKLEKWKIPNKSLLATLSLLTRTKDKKGNYFSLDYATLGTRHLGSIYERLLEYHLTVKDGKVADLPNPKERKSTGSYYTPKYIVDYIVENSIGPLIDDIVKNTEYPEEQIDKILTLNVLDPAMGSGHFLIGVTNYIARRICEIEYKDDITEQAFVERKRDVVRRCIYGVDLNPLAVDLASVSLWLETLASDKPLSFLSAHLKQGNSLIGSSIDDILEKQTTLVETTKGRIRFKKTIRDFLMLEMLEDDTAEAVKTKTTTQSTMQSEGTVYSDLKLILNAKLAKSFDVDVPPIGDYVAKIGENNLDFYSDEIWHKVKEIAEKYLFFHWDLEFLDIFYGDDGKRKKNPGFDCVVGNPPYIEIKKINDVIKPYLQRAFQYTGKNILKGRFDIFWAFIVMGINSLRVNGKLGLLTEDSILDAVYGDTLRIFMIQETTIDGFKYTGKFPSANVHTVITMLTKIKTLEYEFVLENWINGNKIKLSKSSFLNQEKQIINLNVINQNKKSKKILSKIRQNTYILSNIVFLQQGIIVQWGSGSNLEKTKKNCIFSNKKKNCVPYLEGKDVSRYRFPEIHNWLEYRPDKHHRPRMKEVFKNTKLLIRRIATDSIICLLDYGYYFTDNTLFTGTRWIDLATYSQYYNKQISRIIKKLGKTLHELSEISTLFEYEYLLAILNSKLMTFYYDSKFDTKSLDVLTQCRIKYTSLKTQKKIGALAIELQKLNSEFYKNKKKLLKKLPNNLSSTNILKILDDIDEFNSHDFLIIMRQGITLPSISEKNLVNYYNVLLKLKKQIQIIDDKINCMIYDVYDLTDSEVKIVEKSVRPTLKYDNLFT